MLNIKMAKCDDIATVTLEGVIDAYSCRQFEEVFNQLMELGDYKLIVDLSQVNYMTAVGATICMAAHNMAKENKGNLLFVHPQPAVKEIFGLIGLDRMAAITDTKDAALRSFCNNIPGRAHQP